MNHRAALQVSMEQRVFALACVSLILSSVAGSAAVSLCSDGELRLVDGPTAFAGRLEICFDNVWGTVCDRFRSWSGNVNPAVVCRQLGYDTNYVTVSSYPEYGEGSDPIYLSDVNCRGDEVYLNDCEHTVGGNSSGCAHYSDVTINCYGSYVVRSRARLLQQRFSVLEGEDLPEMCLEIRSERERIAPTTVFGGSSYGTALEGVDYEYFSVQFVFDALSTPTPGPTPPPTPASTSGTAPTSTTLTPSTPSTGIPTDSTSTDTPFSDLPLSEVKCVRPDPSVIQDDDKYEGPVPETIPLNFYARQGNVETSDADASAIVYIVDDEVVPLGLQEESYTVAEDGGNVTVCVQLGDSPGLDWPVVMEVFTSPLTALEGSDYQPVVPQIATFPSGSAPGDVWCTDIAIIDDSTREEPETFTFKVAVDGIQLLLHPATAVITILDNDGMSNMFTFVEKTQTSGSSDAGSATSTPALANTHTSGTSDSATSTQTEPSSFTMAKTSTTGASDAATSTQSELSVAKTSASDSAPSTQNDMSRSAVATHTESAVVPRTESAVATRTESAVAPRTESAVAPRTESPTATDSVPSTPPSTDVSSFTVMAPVESSDTSGTASAAIAEMSESRFISKSVTPGVSGKSHGLALRVGVPVGVFLLMLLAVVIAVVGIGLFVRRRKRARDYSFQRFSMNEL